MSDELKTVFHSSLITHHFLSRLPHSPAPLPHDLPDHHLLSLFLIGAPLLFSGAAALLGDSEGILFAHAGRKLSHGPGPERRSGHLSRGGSRGRLRPFGLHALILWGGLRRRAFLDGISRRGRMSRRCE